MPRTSASAPRYVLAVASFALLVGCVRDDVGWSEEMGEYSVVELAQQSPVSLEKRVLRALTRVEATDAERRTVLDAFDAMQTRQRGVTDAADAAQRRRDALDVRAADYLVQLDPLLAESARLQQQSERAAEEFRHAVATALPAERWSAFNAALRDQAREGGLARQRRR